ncbi:MAG: ankyrin repeat domain-containing protein [Calditrichaceae bacterium]|nr:ankyrin repeat domain-containing protein [Calditrichaceae bacterium]MBN2709509.1 ankyrin repeat domain-containing protein [Calditrichaceae bacterium]
MKSYVFYAFLLTIFLYVYSCSQHTLHKAITTNNDREVVEQINAKKKLNTRNEKGQTPLDLAVIAGNRDYVKMLLDAGANINEGAVFRAVSCPDTIILKLFLDRISDVNIIEINRETPLHRACREAKYTSAKKLLIKGASVNARDNHDNTPLLLAACADNPEIIKLLVQHGAEINAANKDGETALHTAAINNQNDAVKYLMDKGANPNLMNKNSYTPLHAAIFAGNEKVINTFIEREVNAYIIGKIPMDLFITAKLYKYYGDFYTKKGYETDAQESYTIAMAYYDKAYRSFGKKSQELKNKATANALFNVLGFIAASAQAYGSAIRSPYGGGVGVYSTRETGSLEQIAESYKMQSDDCLKSAHWCYDALDCLKSNHDKHSAEKCIQSIAANPQKSINQDELQKYWDTAPYKRYEQEIRQKNKENLFATILIPTHKLMARGIYNKTSDPNIELARRTSLEQFINAFTQIERLRIHIDLLKNSGLISENEIFICFMDDCVLTSKKLYLFEDNALTENYKISDILKIRSEPGVFSVTNYIDFVSGTSVEIEEDLPNNAYIELIKENNL